MILHFNLKLVSVSSSWREKNSQDLPSSKYRYMPIMHLSSLSRATIDNFCSHCNFIRHLILTASRYHILNTSPSSGSSWIKIKCIYIFRSKLNTYASLFIKWASPLTNHTWFVFNWEKKFTHHLFTRAHWLCRGVKLAYTYVCIIELLYCLFT